MNAGHSWSLQEDNVLCSVAQIRVLPSQSKNRLYLGNLPKTMSKDELEAQVRAATKGALLCTHLCSSVWTFVTSLGSLMPCTARQTWPKFRPLHGKPTEKKLQLHHHRCPAGLESVELLMSKEIPGQNRGFCFLEFYNHACAQHAKAALSPPNFQ